MNEEADESDLTSAVANDRSTRDRFLSAIPKDLRKREDSLMERFRWARADPVQQLAMLYRPPLHRACHPRVHWAIQ